MDKFISSKYISAVQPESITGWLDNTLTQKRLLYTLEINNLVCVCVRVGSVLPYRAIAIERRARADGGGSW